MSSFIAVCVTFLGLTLIVVNVAVFLQMLLSFPAMLSSNSQVYVQQRRKLHHIPSYQEDLDADYAVSPDAEAEDEWETTARWVDEAEEEDEQDEQDEQGELADDCSSEVCVTSPRTVVSAAPAAAASRSDSMTRGRPLRRQRRRYIAKTVLRVKDIGRVLDSDYESEYSETERRPVARGPRSRDRADCRGGWRGMDWTR